MRYPYISGPMSNIEHHNFPLFFQCEAELHGWGYQPFNPARRTAQCTWKSAYENVLVDQEPWESCIKRDVRALLQTDGIVLMPNWHQSRGACLELVMMVSLGYPVYTWFPSKELQEVEEVSLYYQLALDHLKFCGTISPTDIYNPSRPMIY